jgi:DNA uptake protein ComE-like DNA-binding protein
MATPAEKKALLFLGIVALLGASVRLWHVHHTSTRAKPSLLSRSQTYHKRTSTKKSSSRRNTRSTYTGSLRTVDLDVASLRQIEALGVVDPAIARMIVADRDSFGPFGSVTALKRIPYLSAATIRKLAPYVTFSRLPRPSNAVIQESRRSPVSKQTRSRTRSR